MKTQKFTLAIGIKIALGLIFIFSAISKLISINQFEIYIFSYHFINLNLSMIAARLVIAAELIIGIGFLTNIYHKLFWWGNILMLVGFTFLVLYAWIIGRNDSCHCFGDILPFTPIQSFIKNLILLGLSALCYKVESNRWPFQKLILAALIVLPTTTVFIISPPDNFIKAFSKPSENIDKNILKESFLQQPLDTIDINNGKKVLCFYSTGCQYCKMAAHKLSIIQDLYQFHDNQVYAIFFGSEKGVEKFYKESESRQYQHVIVEPKTLIQITKGKFPTIAFINNGVIELEYGYRNLNEKEIKRFFEKE